MGKKRQSTDPMTALHRAVRDVQKAQGSNPAYVVTFTMDPETLSEGLHELHAVLDHFEDLDHPGSGSVTLPTIKKLFEGFLTVYQSEPTNGEVMHHDLTQEVEEPDQHNDPKEHLH